MPGTVRIERLTVSPVKSLALHEVESVELGPRGVAGDRRFFLVDERGRILNGLRCGRLSTAHASWDGATLAIRLSGGERVAGEPRLGEPIDVDWELGYSVAGRVVDGPFADALASLAGRPVRLVQAGEERAGWSEHPVSLIGSASIAVLRTPGLDPQRFRMLVEVSGGEPNDEDDWIGRRVRVGAAVIGVRKACTRCATTTRDPRTGVRDFDTLRTLLQERGSINLGVYADVVMPGRVHVGDVVEPL